MPRRMRQSVSALRKLIRSIATADIAGWEANSKERFPLTTTPAVGGGQGYWDTLPIGPACGPIKLEINRSTNSSKPLYCNFHDV